jgi:hypothetical protein
LRQWCCSSRPTTRACVPATAILLMRGGGDRGRLPVIGRLCDWQSGTQRTRGGRASLASAGMHHLLSLVGRREAG